MEAMDGQSLRATKALTGVDHTTISAILQGKVWPDLQTISRLEAGLGTDLWPGVASRHASARKAKR
jgi:transcriptional regulator with XRE-family HTH domain